MSVFFKLIIQKILFVIYFVTSFLGFTSGEIPTHEEFIVATENRKHTIQELLQKTLITGNIAGKLEEVVKDASVSLKHNKDSHIQTTHFTLPDFSELVSALPDDKRREEINEIIEEKISDTNKEKEEPKKESKPAVIIPTIIEVVSEVEKIITPHKETNPETIVEIGNSIPNVVVNIVCVREDNNLINVSTGSGVVISSSGVILTNSHIAQFFLLQDYNDNFIDCSIYRENKPDFGYKAETLYVSPDWIRNNSKTLSESAPTGTGENDYALLLINATTNSNKGLPTSFPHANIVLTKPETNQLITAAGYPGSPASLSDITKAVRLVTDYISVEENYTFTDGAIDIFSTTKSLVGARGSSGGGIFEGRDLSTSDLIGITATTNGIGGNAHINALSLSYINTDIKKDSGHNLDYYLRGNLESKAEDFQQNYLAPLAKILLKNF